MSGWLQRYMHAGFVPGDDPDLVWRGRALAIMCVSTGLACIPLVVNQLRSGVAPMAAVFGLTGVISWLMPLWRRSRRGLLLSTHGMVVLGFGAMVTAAVFRGGLSSSLPMVLALVPALAAYLFRDRRPVMIWAAITLSTIAGLAVVPELLGVELVDRMAPAGRAVIDVLGPTLLLGLVTALVRANFRVQAEATARAAQAERRRLQLEQATRLERADQMALVGQLAVGVAHEVNNPLSYMFNNLEYVIDGMRERSGDEAFAEWIEALKEGLDGAQRIAAIVERLSAHGRPHEEQVQPVPVAESLEAALGLAHNQLRHRARIVRDYAMEPVVMVDPGRLTQVFLNLLVNAAQSLPTGKSDEHEVRVSIRAGASGHAVVEIEDTGCGIPPELQDKVLQPFFTTREVGEGTGLGLSITDAIVRGYRGALMLDSEPGRGTRVRVELPVTDEEPSRPVDRRAPAATASVRRVLVIDDDPVVRRSLVRILVGPQVEVVPVGHVREALDQLARDPEFDVIVCDVMMPELTGLDFHRELARSHPSLLRRLLFLTGGVFEASSQEQLSKLQVPLLTKPVARRTLEAAIEEVAANDARVSKGGGSAA